MQKQNSQPANSKLMYETSHLCLDRSTLVYNFFDSEAEALAFVEANKDNPNVYGLSYMARYWHESFLPPEGTKSQWQGDVHTLHRSTSHSI